LTLALVNDPVVLVDDAGWLVNGLKYGGGTGYAVLVTFGGTVWDITAYAATITARRGRTRELDTFTTGTATIDLQNYDRIFDPLYTAGPFYGLIVPRIPVTITKDGTTIFGGVVEDWGLQYEVDGTSVAAMMCVDRLAILAQTQLNAYTNVQSTPGARIAAVIGRPEIAYTGATNLDGGFAILQADTVAQDTDTLGYLQQVTQTDVGRLFVDRSGVLRYRDRTSGVTSGETVIFADAATSYTAPVVKFSAIKVEVGSEFLFNRVTATRTGGVAQTVSDATSIASYGIRSLARGTVLFNDDADTSAYAAYLLSQYKDATIRVVSHDVVLGGLGATAKAAMLALEIGDTVRTVWTPRSTGNQVDVLSLVEGIEHRIGVDVHTMTVQLTPLTVGGFILGSATDGILGTSVLTY
jgi:hypothetical protein